MGSMYCLVFSGKYCLVQNCHARDKKSESVHTHLVELMSQYIADLSE